MKNIYYLPSIGQETFPTLSVNQEEAPDLEMHLTPHFKLKEFIQSATAIQNQIDNTPPPEELERLKALAENVLEPLRMQFGAIRITSGYRCYRLNKMVNGARDSQHLYGEAVDIHCGSTEIGRKYYQFILENLNFDQMLLEFAGKKQKRIHCLHVSFKTDRGVNRRICKSYYPI